MQSPPLLTALVPRAAGARLRPPPATPPPAASPPLLLTSAVLGAFGRYHPVFDTRRNFFEAHPIIAKHETNRLEPSAAFRSLPQPSAAFRSLTQPDAALRSLTQFSAAFRPLPLAFHGLLTFH